MLTPLGVNGDTITQAAWGNWIYHHGFLGFYDENVWAVEWPNHPPLISIWYGEAYRLHSTLMAILTNMYERYAFAGVFFGLLLCLFNIKLLKLWIPLSLIYLLDMYHGWWYPDWLPFFQGFLYSGNWFFSRVLSLINIGLFIAMINPVLPKIKINKKVLA